MRPRLAALLAAALLAAPLAGCAGPAAEPAPTQSATGAPPQAAPALALPSWAVRDWWAYRVGDETATYVVTEETGDAWRMETDSAVRAFQDARDDISRLGPQRKSDLAGSQGSDAVVFFHWPLRAGETWTTPWDHVPLTIRVLAVDGATARLEARDANGTVVYTYTYDAGVGWFRELRHLAPDGSDLVRLELAGSGHNWTGQVVRWELQPVLEQGAALAQQRGFTVAEGTTDLWLSYRATCSSGSGGYLVAVKPQDPAAASEGYESNGQCGDVAVTATVDAPRPGNWLATSSMGGDPATTAFSFELLQRILHTTQVG